MKVSLLVLVCVLVAAQFQPSESHFPPILKGKGLGKATYGKDAGGTALAAVISSRKLGLGLKAIIFKPLLLVALAKIKLALLLGKPLALIAIKKLLLKAVLGKLLLKIPLILLKGKALLVKMLALKFALVTKGLLGLKAPLAMLFLGACSLGSGLGLALALGASLHKLKEQDSYEEDDYGYDEPSYALPPPQPAYAPPPSYSPPSPYAPAPASPAPAPYPVGGAAGAAGYGGEYAASQQALYANSGLGGAFASSSYNGRGKRHAIDAYDSSADEEDSNEEVDDSSAEENDSTADDIQLEFEAARTNGNAYLYMAAQFDEQSCGRRLLCEVYQKPHETLTEDEILLQDIFGYPLPPLSEEDAGTPKEMYYRAAQLGASYQGRANDKVCARFYPSCPHNAQQLIHIFTSSEDVQSNEIDVEHKPSNHLQPPSSSARIPFFVPNAHQTLATHGSGAAVHARYGPQPVPIKTDKQQQAGKSYPTAPLVRQRLLAPAA